jgi:hypothetical protein
MFQTSSPAPSPVSAIQQSPQARQPSEFTKMFQAAPAPPSQIQTPPSAEGSGPDEFTRMFQAVPPPAQQPQKKEPVRADPMQQPTPGDFDKLFNAPPAPSTPASHPAFRDPFGSQRKPGSPQPTEPDGFTKMFGTPSPAPAGLPQAPVPQPSPPAPVMGTYTAMFSAPGTAAPQAPVQSPAAPQGQPPATGGEFTRAFPRAGAGPPQSVLVKPAGQSAPKQSPRKTPSHSNLVPLYVILGVLLTALVIVVSVMAFR